MIELVCVKWGTRYSAGEVNYMFHQAQRHASEEIRFTCITDDLDGAFDPEIRKVPFPEFSKSLDFMKFGCLAKLAIFAKGIFEPGVPVIFFDLDTMIMGDVARLAAVIRKRRGINMMPNHWVQFWRYQNYIRPLLGNRYYFANSSLMGFFPEDGWVVFDRLQEAFKTADHPLPKAIASDERFVSSQASEQVKVFPKNLAVKFADEFIMTRWLAFESVYKRLPWVAARRKNLVAITFVSDVLKPRVVINYKPGELIHYKRRPHIWVHEDFSEYWRRSLET